MKVFITNLPSFYKINLYNQINRHCKITVIYTGLDGEDRNTDFFRGDMSFDYVFLKGNTFQKIRQTLDVLHDVHYKELIISGWDSIIYWIAAFASPKSKNALAVESSIKESTTKGFKGLCKRIFCTRISKGYASGHAHAALLQALGLKGKIRITKGVGIFNYIPQPPYVPRSQVTRFLYVGRLVPVKNLELLIHVFNNLPELQLSIVGFGEQEQKLRTIAGKNTIFLGAVNNRDLPHIYQQHDVFILPSKSETWGIVVEEALNNGVPVIVSNQVGCAADIVTQQTGLVFQWDSPEALTQAIQKMRDLTFYNTLRKNISMLNFEQIESRQINCYLD